MLDGFRMAVRACRQQGAGPPACSVQAADVPACGCDEMLWHALLTVCNSCVDQQHVSDYVHDARFTAGCGGADAILMDHTRRDLKTGCLPHSSRQWPGLLRVTGLATAPLTQAHEATSSKQPTTNCLHNEIQRACCIVMPCHVTPPQGTGCMPSTTQTVAACPAPHKQSRRATASQSYST
jgi:hypothetical protein